MLNKKTYKCLTYKTFNFVKLAMAPVDTSDIRFRFNILLQMGKKNIQQYPLYMFKQKSRCYVNYFQTTHKKCKFSIIGKSPFAMLNK